MLTRKNCSLIQPILRCSNWTRSTTRSYAPTFNNSDSVTVVLSITIQHYFFKHLFTFLLMTYKLILQTKRKKSSYLVFAVHHTLKCFEVFELIRSFDPIFFALQPSQLCVRVNNIQCINSTIKLINLITVLVYMKTATSPSAQWKHFKESSDLHPIICHSTFRALRAPTTKCVLSYST